MCSSKFPSQIQSGRGCDDRHVSGDEQQTHRRHQREEREKMIERNSKPTGAISEKRERRWLRGTTNPPTPLARNEIKNVDKPIDAINFLSNGRPTKGQQIRRWWEDERVRGRDKMRGRDEERRRESEMRIKAWNGMRGRKEEKERVRWGLRRETDWVRWGVKPYLFIY